MAESEKPTPSALLQIHDILGLSAASKRLVDGIVVGVGEWVRPWQHARTTRADINAFRDWSAALKAEGMNIDASELSIDQRAAIRINATAAKKQANREAIALKSVSEYQSDPALKSDSGGSIDTDWLTRFWRLAEDISQEDFQSLWARILARKAIDNKGLSLRCLDMLSLLSSEEAAMLERLATSAIRPMRDGYLRESYLVHSISVAPNGNRMSDRHKFDEAVRHSTYPWHEEIFSPAGFFLKSGFVDSISSDVINGTTLLSIAGAKFSISNYQTDKSSVDIGGGIRFSLVGEEILGLIRAQPNDALLKVLTEAFQSTGLELKPIG